MADFVECFEKMRFKVQSRGTFGNYIVKVVNPTCFKLQFEGNESIKVIGKPQTLQLIIEAPGFTFYPDSLKACESFLLSVTFQKTKTL